MNHAKWFPQIPEGQHYSIEYISNTSTFAVLSVQWRAPEPEALFEHIGIIVVNKTDFDGAEKPYKAVSSNYQSSTNTTTYHEALEMLQYFHTKQSCS